MGGSKRVCFWGCQKSVAVFIVVVKKRCDIQTFFSTTTYAALLYFGTLLWKTVQTFFSTTPYATLPYSGTLLWKTL